MPTHYDHHETAAKKIIDHVGKTIVIGVPVGIGKPIGLLNALYRSAEEDPSIYLTIITGLTLSRPSFHNELKKRFIQPILDRILGDYEDPLYESARKSQQLPDNIKVIEFFLTPGEYLHNHYAQQNYISSRYTSVLDDAIYYSINVLAQQVAHSSLNPEEYSLSCNTDLFHEMAQHLRKSQLENKKIAIVAEVNLQLPFMPGDDAVVNSNVFTDIIDTGHYRTLFSIPRERLSTQDHLIGLYTSCLIKDDSCLQIGIGTLSNAVTHALVIRHNQNKIYHEMIKQLSVKEKFGDVLSSVGALDSFAAGLYASTEMFSDDYLHLYTEKIVKKHVYDHIGLQQLLNSKIITENITPNILDILLENRIIHPKLTDHDAEFLLKFGIFKSEIFYQAGNVVLPSGETIPADLNSEFSKQTIIKKCLGTQLKTGKIIHAGFFIGSSEFYQKLRALSSNELQKISMTSIARTNTLSWSYELEKLQRQQARFINFAMMVTVDGAIVSDGLKNLQEVSGVGGQFDFIHMAHTLPQARSIIACRSTKKIHKKTQSNIVWDYSNVTIPRYFRDIVVTEYGIADCRSKTDAEVIKSLLNITDSRFQNALLIKAKKYGKLPQHYEIPAYFQQNYPDNIEPVICELQSKGYCNPYPFGSDLTDEEQIIERALLFFKSVSVLKQFIFIIRSFLFFKATSDADKYLIRMQLQYPKNIKEYFYKKLLLFSIYQSKLKKGYSQT